MAKYFTKDGDEYKEVEDTLLTQDEVDNTIIPKRLDRERKKFSDYDDLKQKAEEADKIKTEYEEKLEGVTTEKQELEKKLKDTTLEVDRVKIVNEFKLSDDLAEFVTGESADDMRKRAEKLAKGVTSGVSVDKKEKPEEKASDSKVIASKLFGSSSD